MWYELLMKLLSGKCHRKALMVNQHWANVASDLPHHIAPLGRNELTTLGVGGS